MLTIRKLYLFICFFSLFSCGGGGSGIIPETHTSSPSDNEDYSSCDSLCSSYQTQQYNNQMGLDDINAAQAYSFLSQNNLNIAGDGIKIAIVDTGIIETHDNLIANIDTVNSVPDGAAEDSNGHGTHVAGIAAASQISTNNSIHGVAFNSTIVGVANNYLTEVDSGTYDLKAPIINSNSTVVNMSFGGSSNSNSLNNQLINILNDPNIGDKITYVAATGNSRYSLYGSSPLGSVWDSSGNNPYYPAANATDANMNGQMIAVAALNLSSYYYDITYNTDTVSSYNVRQLNNIDNTISFYSNYCGSTSRYCLAAPGGDSYNYSGDPTLYNVYSTYNNSNSSYAYLSGTSMAAPHVSGAAAILQSAWPSLTGSEVVSILLESADYLSCNDLKLPSKASCTETVISGQTGSYLYNNVTGWGALNLSAAVAANGSFDMLSGQEFDSLAYNLNESKIKISSSLANKLLNSDIFNQAVFFDGYNRDYRANLEEKFNIISQSRQTINFENDDLYKYIIPSQNFLIALTNNTNFADNLNYTEEYDDFELTNLYYNHKLQNINLSFSFNENFLNYSLADQYLSETNSIFDFNQEDRLGLQLSKKFQHNINYRFSFYTDNNNINEFHNSLELQKNNSHLELIFAFIDSSDNIINMSGNEAFSFGSDNKNQILGFNFLQKISKNNDFFVDYRHMFFDESNNGYGVLRNFRNLAQNSLAFGLSRDYSNKLFSLSVYFPPAFISGDVDVNVAIGRDEFQIIRAEETIEMKDLDRQINYNLNMKRIFKHHELSMQYSYINNLSHEPDVDDQLLFVNLTKRF